MKKSVLLVFMICISFQLFASGGQENAGRIIVFAAASTADLLEEAAELYCKTNDVDIKLNPASSGTCAKQLEQGAFADIFISASGKWIKYIDELDLLSLQSALMENGLVVISPIDSTVAPFSLNRGTAVPRFTGRISIADPAHAPAGKYAVEAMKTCGWYEELIDRFLPGADVRRALSVVEFGEAELGIVYKTDADKSGKVKTVSVFPADCHSPIRYYCGLTRDASSAGADFYEFLTTSSEMAELIIKYGFKSGGSL